MKGHLQKKSFGINNFRKLSVTARAINSWNKTQIKSSQMGEIALKNLRPSKIGKGDSMKNSLRVTEFF